MQTKKPSKLNMVLKTALLVAILLVCLFSVGDIFAKYISSSKQGVSNSVTPFHISSNYLSEDGNTLDVNKTLSSIEIEIYNYEISNASLISNADISYTIEASSGWEYVVKDKNGNALSISSSYCINALEQGELKMHTISFIKTGEQSSLSVSIHTTSPYTKTLSATFNLVGNTVPDYSVQNFDEYVLITIETNDFSGNITINWNASLYAPDNTNSLMELWQNANPSNIFSADAHCTYELMFFKKTSVSYTTSGSGTTITLGGA